MKENPTAHTDACLCILLPVKNQAVSDFLHAKSFTVSFPFVLRPKSVQEKWPVKRNVCSRLLTLFHLSLPLGCSVDHKSYPISWLQLCIWLAHDWTYNKKQSVWELKNYISVNININVETLLWVNPCIFIFNSAFISHCTQKYFKMAVSSYQTCMILILNLFLWNHLISWPLVAPSTLPIFFQPVRLEIVENEVWKPLEWS